MQSIDSINTEFGAMEAKEEENGDSWYQAHYAEILDGEYSDEEVERLGSGNAEAVTSEWEAKANEAHAKAKKLVDDYFRNSQFDGINLQRDEGSFGRETETYIVFDPEQVKSATDNVGTFDPKDKNIQYSLKDSEGNKLTKEQQEFFKDSKVRDEDGNLKVMYHGTSYGGYDRFRSGTYFSDMEWYADGYQSPSASSAGSSFHKSRY